MTPERIRAVENALALEELRRKDMFAELRALEASDIQNIRASAATNRTYGGGREEILIVERQVQTLKEFFQLAVRLRENSLDMVPELEEKAYYDGLTAKLEEIANGYYQVRLDRLRRESVSLGKTAPIPNRFDLERNALITDARDRVEVLRRTRQMKASLNSQPIQAKAKDTRKVFVVHGRNTNARNAMFEFLRSIDLAPIEWSEAVDSNATPTLFCFLFYTAGLWEAVSSADLTVLTQNFRGSKWPPRSALGRHQGSYTMPVE
jgi:hypothetical protein